MEKTFKIIAYAISVIFICACGSAGNVKPQDPPKAQSLVFKKSVEKKYHRRKIPGLRARIMVAIDRAKPMVLGYDKKLGYLGKRYDEAITYIQRQKREYPNLNGAEASALNSYLGQAFVGLKNYEEAINVYQETLSYSPRLPTAHESISYLGIAKAHLELNNAEAAISTLKDYELAISEYNAKGPRRIWKPDSAFTLVKGEVALVKGDYEGAVNLYEKVLCLAECKKFKSFYAHRDYENLKLAYQRYDAKNNHKRIKQLNSILKKKNIKPRVLYRSKSLPIIIPSNAPKRGGCSLKFDVNEKGKAKNIKVVECSDRYFEHLSLKTVEDMIYEPSFGENGQAVVTRGVFHEVRY